MLKISIISIGKIKEKYITDGIAEFSKRLKPYVNFNIIELKEAVDSNNSHIIDSQSIIKYLDKNPSYVILLDLSGKEVSSEELASIISKTSMINSNISFVIGGSRGFDENIRKLSNMRLSFSKLTFPHQLFRLIVVEQIYRSICIINNIKYHK